MQFKEAPPEALLNAWQPLPEDTDMDARLTQYCQDHVIIKKDEQSDELMAAFG